MDEQNQDNKKVWGYVWKSVVGLFALTLVWGMWFTIDAGQRGVVTRFGSVVRTAAPGFNFKFPWIEDVAKMDVQTQKDNVDAVEAASQDLQMVRTNVAVNYHLDPSSALQIYQNVGIDYVDRVMTPAIQESVKAVTAKFTAEQLITQRENVRNDVISLLSAKMGTFGITVDALNITNFDFSDSFNQAIENKVTTEQNALAAKNKLDQVKYEADQRVAQAEGEAKAIAIQAQAIQQQGGAEYVRLKAIEKWNGTLPTYMTGGSPVPFIDVNSK